MSSKTDYTRVPVPAEKRPTEYSYAERRAELLQLTEEAGHPRLLNQTELGERYGVSQQQISKDFDRLAEYVSNHIGEDHAFIMQTVFHGSMLQLVEEGDPFRAAKVARWWSEWIQQWGSSAITDKEEPISDINDGSDEEALEICEALCRDTVSDEFSVEH